MDRERRAAAGRAAGWCLVAAGGVFLLTVGYLFTVLTGLGLRLELFDDAAGLLAWSAEHERAYAGLWLLYFLAQLALLPVPTLLALAGGRGAGTIVAAVVGTVAVTLAVTGLVVQLAAAPQLAGAYAAAADDAGRAAVVVVHDVAAAVGKDLRLFSELLLGLWLVAVARLGAAAVGGRTAAIPLALGLWTLLVAGWKIADPLVGLEDWLGFVLGAGQLAWGAAILRARAGSLAPVSTPRAGGTAR